MTAVTGLSGRRDGFGVVGASLRRRDGFGQTRSGRGDEGTGYTIVMLEIRHLTKSYGAVKAVDDLSLTIDDGDIFGFIGLNGAGKTTTIKAVVGIHPFDSGEILINGTSISADPIAAKRQLAYIPDNPDVYEFMTGGKYLNFVADIFAVGRRERQERIEKYATGLELTDDLSSPIGSYSHGMMQKLVVIGALIHQPKLLVLDEPFVGLDPRATFVLKGYFREMTARGDSIFFSTHGLDVAQSLCDKIAIIQKGVLLEAGATGQIVGKQSLESVFLELTAEGERAQ
ncbi:MAG: ABC transporter ATP-binding protein [Propionibacteriaceae bacterium]|nr:ABC transporter ATP-binding protein [Propionibacteriaceae bacterium]